MLSIKNSSISKSLSSVICLLQLDLDGMSDQYALPNLFTTRYMQFLTLYISWMRAVSANFKETCGILVCSVEKVFCLRKVIHRVKFVKHLL